MIKIVEDKFNTEIFQFKMGNLIFEDMEKVTDRELDCIENQAGKEGYSHLTMRVPSINKKLLNIALKKGYFFADTLIEYIFDMKKSKLPSIQHQCILRDCEEHDLEYLKKIAGSSFVMDRFHADEHLENSLCNLYYEKWVENSYHGFAEKIVVAEYNHEPAGFTTANTHQGDKHGRLVLSAVSDKYRGIGIYTSMIHESMAWMLREHRDLEGVVVGTQLSNIAVQKAWIKLGFTIFNSLYVLQKYIEE